MTDDGDRLLRIVGAVLVGALVVGGGVAALAAVTAPSRAPAPPDADWTLERVDDTHVRLVHAGGDAVDAERLVVTVDGYDRPATWSGSVDPGESGLVRASGGQLVRLYWDPGRGTLRRLGRWRVGATETPTAE